MARLTPARRAAWAGALLEVVVAAATAEEQRVRLITAGSDSPEGASQAGPLFTTREPEGPAMPDIDLTTVAARFYVAEVTQHAYGPKGSGQVKLSAVSRGDQNKDWASATPAGQITMTINNPPAFAFFRDHLGDDISLVFQPVATHHPEDGHPYRVSEAPPGSVYAAPNCGDCGQPEDAHVWKRGPA